MTKWEAHKKKWINCKKCWLHETRTKVCLYRGSIPADILFVGEAPGQSEDILGNPFVGVAGHLLDSIVSQSLEGYLKVGFTNIVGCLPRDKEDNKSKVIEPDKESISACSPRLDQLFDFAIKENGLIVAVGWTASKLLIPNNYPKLSDYIVVSIAHPAFILRCDAAKKELQIKSACITLRDAWENVQERRNNTKDDTKKMKERKK